VIIRDAVTEMVTTLYADIDPRLCRWIRGCIREGMLPDGEVVEHDIRDMEAGDVAGYGQVHFFAGIGGWAYALRLAGWPGEWPVWTGSCPCPPFSLAGKKRCQQCGGRLGFAAGYDSLIGRFGCEKCRWTDKRHLWPAWLRLIRQCRPPVLFGEQVAGPTARRWLAGVRSDLEAVGYAVGAADLCAASVGAPHPRQRLFWMAITKGFGYKDGCKGKDRRTGRKDTITRDSAKGDRMADIKDPENGRPSNKHTRANPEAPWADFSVVWCRDPRLGLVPRRTEPGVLPLAHGLPQGVGSGGTRSDRMELLAAKANRRGRLRGYGNAIVPQLAAVFVRVVMEYIKRRRPEDAR